MVDFAGARRMMVEGQVRTNDITDPPLLAAMLELPRELFVPANKQGLAYLDLDLPVLERSGEVRRCLLKPMVLAKLLQAAGISGSDRVLDIGCATGYSSALLSPLCREVLALEEHPVLAGAAEETLRTLGLHNVTVRRGQLTAGAPADAPFDVIVINGAVEVLPDALRRQLNEGGRLVCVVRHGAVGKAMLYRAAGGDVSGRPIFDAAAPLLPGFVQPAAFVF
jgi:protein-L-isoaspartate(D-aspartate) O-methyltransferase